MSTFNVGDVVVRVSFLDPESSYRMLRGEPVVVTRVEKCGDENDDVYLGFSEEDGGHGWYSGYFNLYHEQLVSIDDCVESISKFSAAVLKYETAAYGLGYCESIIRSLLRYAPDAVRADLINELQTKVNKWEGK